MSNPVLLAYYNPVKLEPYRNPEDARTQAVGLGASLTMSKGTVLGQKTADGLYYPYVDANSDGTGVAKAVLVYDCVTDSAGNVILGNTGTVVDLTHAFETTAEVYVAGTFLETDLTGYDAAALTDLKGREYGIGTSKYIVIPQ
jgi:hypothetical protein